MTPKAQGIIRGDCIAGMAALGAASVDLVFADPPFNIGYEYDVYDDRRKTEEYLDWSRRWIGGVVRVLKPNGTFWLAIGDEYAADLKVLCTREFSLHCRNWVIWFYTFGVHCKQKFTRSHAHLFYFVKDQNKFTFNSLDVRVPSARELVYGDKRAHPDGRVPDDTWMMSPILPPEVPTRDGFVLRPQDIPDRFPQHSDTWFFSRVAGTFRERRGWHGCQMPEQLLGRIIRACSNESDFVLDPFAGSGTTLAVSKKLNRRFLGFELSKRYVHQTEKRLASINPHDRLDGPADAAKSAPPTNIGRRLNRRKDNTEPDVQATRSPLFHRLNTSMGQIAVGVGELNTALIEAYLAASEGYAIDRVIADPTLNAAYLQACRDLLVPLLSRECNSRILALRKAGKLSMLPRPRKTVIAWETIEPFAFASEIAWQIIAGRGYSLDDILCDPKLASEFDKTASRFQPGYQPFDYRWAALTLRKQASDRRSLAKRQLAPERVQRLLTKKCNDPLELTRIPTEPGLYVIRDPEKCLYVGDTTDLRSRVQTHSNFLNAFEMVGQDQSQITLAVAPFPGSQEARWGVHSRLLGILRPRLNEKKQAYVARSR